MKNGTKRKKTPLIFLLCISLLLATGCMPEADKMVSFSEEITQGAEDADLSSIPEFSGDPFVTLNENEPEFEEEELTTEAFENYSELDALGRCGVAFANICKELMPIGERESIGAVKPSGWHTVKYNHLINGNYLYNRCHLIGYQLADENANEKNLITGTRYLNVEGMLPFENLVADYVNETGNHVLYRVTPIYYGSNLVASGVQMEALSVEDDGEGVKFNVYCYNDQPGIAIDYATGDSHEAEMRQESEKVGNDPKAETYIINTNTGKFHKPDCGSVSDMKEKNKLEFKGNRDDLAAQGFSSCGRCHP